MDSLQKASMDAGTIPSPHLQEDTDMEKLSEQEENSVAGQALMQAEAELEASQPQFKQSDRIDLHDDNTAVTTEFGANKRKAECGNPPTDEQPGQTENLQLVPFGRPCTPVHQVSDSQQGMIGNDTACTDLSQEAIVKIKEEISKLLPALNDKHLDALEKTLVACGIKSREDMVHLEPGQLVNVFGTDNAKKVVAHFKSDARYSSLEHIALTGVTRCCADEEKRTEAMCSAAAQEMSNILTEQYNKAQESSRNFERKVNASKEEMLSTYESTAKNIDENMSRSKKEHDMFLENLHRLRRMSEAGTVLSLETDDGAHDVHKNIEENGHCDTKCKGKKSWCSWRPWPKSSS